MTSNELVLLLTLVLIRTVFDGLTYKVLKGPDGVENGMIFSRFLKNLFWQFKIFLIFVFCFRYRVD